MKDHSPGFLALINQTKTGIRHIDIQEYQQMLQDGVPHILVDVREESEWAAGHAASAVFLSKGIIERDVEVRIPDKDSTLVLYCGGGYRSVLVADNLQKMGYTNAISLDGGWRAYCEARLPTDPEVVPTPA